MLCIECIFKKFILFCQGQTTISNDGATIMKQLDIVHPAAKLLVDIAKSQDAEVRHVSSETLLSSRTVCVLLQLSVYRYLTYWYRVIVKIFIVLVKFCFSFIYIFHHNFILV